MLRNYFITAWRSLWRNKLHTSINILGLAIGVAACLVIYLLVSYELSFNRGHVEYENIYRIHSAFTGQMSGLNRGAPAAVAPAVRDQFSGVDAVALAHNFSGSVRIPSIDKDKELRVQTALIFTEPSYFDVFQSYEWIAGSAEVLERPFVLVLTESEANNYFGTSDPNKVMGKEIIFRDSLSVTVAGIVRDLPFNTDVDFSDFISLATVEQSWVKKNIYLDDWSTINSGCQIFLKATPGINEEKIRSQLPILAKNFEEQSKWDRENNFALQPLSSFHFDTATGIFDHSRSPAHMPTLMALIGVAILLLIIGAINFVNLETAQSLRRAKEVGVRKVLGSTRPKLVFQFLSQSMIVTLVAVMLALPLAEFGLNAFSEFIPENVSLELIPILPFLAGVIVLIGLLAGLYPAFVMSSFLPALALKSNSGMGGVATGNVFLRKVLIVFQFTFAQVLILSTLVIHSQVSYMITKDLGFKKDAIIYFDSPWYEDRAKAKVLKNELESIPEIKELSMSESPPSYNGWSSSTLKHQGTGGELTMTAFRKYGDSKYIEFYGIDLIAGRNLQVSDTVREFIVNEKLVTALGFEKPEDAIGQEIEYSRKKYPIIGVVKDFHIQSLHKAIDPVIMSNAENDFTCFNIKFAQEAGTGNFTEGIEKIEKAFKKVYPDNEFSYSFLDETLKNFYRSEQRASKLSDTATGLAILISCLGLFGLVSFTTIQRTKEIGIRKVMGASVRSVVMLLSKDFVMLVMIAFVFAAPLAWYSSAYWLKDFAYKIEVNVLMFIVTLILAVAIAFLTVSWKTIGAARANPADSLRTE